MNMVVDNSIWLIGNGESINLWLDNWFGTPLASVLNLTTTSSSSMKLSSVIVDGHWRLPPILLSHPLVAESISNITLPRTLFPDKKVWLHSIDGALTAKQGYIFLQCPLLLLTDLRSYGG
jgi:hypothetical protein